MREGTAEPVSRNQILRCERGKENIHFSWLHAGLATFYPVDPHSCYMCDHIYIMMTITRYSNQEGPPRCFFLFYPPLLCMYGHTNSKSMDQPGEVANPARGQLNREKQYFPVRVRTWEFGFARQVRQPRPASACSSPLSGWIWCLVT